ncbi:hypothetical protein [Streptomyces sp. V4I2]|uniref:hypothetical protein n=1 Tax=Streptomyces sp. V4I2 TaxID=3042280 RepID=UPI0027816DA1|nr:hypothetical protein [Streptomyces sp. V4I2]MDQ1041862.1 hypothetical protein [Streptomyces sp. V4I2]
MTRRVGHRTVRFDVRVRNIAAASLLLGAAFTMTACSGNGGEADSSATTPSVTSSDTPAPATSSANTDPQAAEKAAVLDAYDHFWDEQAKAYAKGDTAGTAFDQYAAAEAMSSTEADLKDLRSKGIVTTGAPTHDTTVDSLAAAKKVPSAKLTDCMDSTDWKFVYRKTGKPVEMPEDRLIRYVTKIDAEKWGKQWKIVNVTPQQSVC